LCVVCVCVRLGRVLVGAFTRVGGGDREAKDPETEKRQPKSVYIVYA